MENFIKISAAIRKLWCDRETVNQAYSRSWK